MTPCFNCLCLNTATVAENQSRALRRLCAPQSDSDRLTSTPRHWSERVLCFCLSQRTGARDTEFVVSTRISISPADGGRVRMAGLTERGKMALPRGQEWQVEPACQGWVLLEVSTINCGSPVQGMKTLTGMWGENPSQVGSAHLQWWGNHWF